MQKVLIWRKFAAADLVVVALVATVIYALVAYGREFHAAYHAAYDIDLSLYSLPYYTLFSALRGMAAFVFSLAFTLVIGYWAAKSARAEKVLIPLLDILQSIPVLGFLPGLVIVLIALFPRTNTGLELACIIMIFTGQVWNMTFSFYSSLTATEPLMRNLIRDSGLLRWFRIVYRRRILHRSLLGMQIADSNDSEGKLDPRRFMRNKRNPSLRVVACLMLGSIWTVPVGIWIGTSQQRIRIAQPIVQVLASFPAPMLYPLAIAVMFVFKIPFGLGAMFLMLLGVQWYILFNVLAGAMRIPVELKYAALLMDIPRVEMWKKLYLPSVFPALVTGWVTAAGGAWNASIVAEYLSYKGTVLTTYGLGSFISVAASSANFPQLAASLTIMVAVVIVLNRTVWARIYHLSQNRFRMDL